MGKMEGDIIRVSDVMCVCEECGEDINVGSMVNEYDDGEETMLYCMKCLPHVISQESVWRKEIE